VGDKPVYTILGISYKNYARRGGGSVCFCHHKRMHITRHFSFNRSENVMYPMIQIKLGLMKFFPDAIINEYENNDDNSYIRFTFHNVKFEIHTHVKDDKSMILKFSAASDEPVIYNMPSKDGRYYMSPVTLKSKGSNKSYQLSQLFFESLLSAPGPIIFMTWKDVIKSYLYRDK
jgi:hypothetical protein